MRDDFSEHDVAEEAIPQHLWRLVVEHGSKLDINKGGYCDAKDACIQFWCGPEDHPTSWNGIEIRKYALNYPRALVGGVYTSYGGDPMTLHWLLYPYEKAAFLEGVRTSADLRHPVEHYGTADDLQWCQAKLKELRDWALAEYGRRLPRFQGAILETTYHCPTDPEHRVVSLDPPFQTWEFYCLDCGALTCVLEKMPERKGGAIGTIIQAGYPRDRILPSE